MELNGHSVIRNAVNTFPDCRSIAHFGGLSNYRHQYHVLSRSLHCVLLLRQASLSATGIVTECKKKYQATNLTTREYLVETRKLPTRVLHNGDMIAVTRVQTRPSSWQFKPFLTPKVKSHPRVLRLIDTNQYVQQSYPNHRIFWRLNANHKVLRDVYFPIFIYPVYFSTVWRWCRRGSRWKQNEQNCKGKWYNF